MPFTVPHGSSPSLAIEDHDPSIKLWPCLNHYNLLLVNKQIHEEAESVLAARRDGEADVLFRSWLEGICL